MPHAEKQLSLDLLPRLILSAQIPLPVFFQQSSSILLPILISGPGAPQPLLQKKLWNKNQIDQQLENELGSYNTFSI